MRKIIACITLIICIFLVGCGNAKKQIAEDSAILTVTNSIDKPVTGFGISCIVGQDTVCSTGVKAADNQTLPKDEAVKFELKKSDLPDNADLNSFGLKFTVNESNGNNAELNTLYFNIKFGEEYKFEIKNLEGKYVLISDVGTAEQMTETQVIDESEISNETIDINNLVGPWHLDNTKNNLSQIEQLFPGYGEWGASMEIRSNGQMSMYLGIEGGSGNYTIDGRTLKMSYQSVSDNTEKQLQFIVADSDETQIEVTINGTITYWAYGDSGEISPKGND